MNPNKEQQRINIIVAENKQKYYIRYDKYNHIQTWKTVNNLARH